MQFKLTSLSLILLGLTAATSAFPMAGARVGRAAAHQVEDRSLDTNAKRLAAGLPLLPAALGARTEDSGGEPDAPRGLISLETW